MQRCLECEKPLSGRQDYFCSNACKMKNYRKRKRYDYVTFRDETLSLIREDFVGHTEPPAGIDKKTWRTFCKGEMPRIDMPTFRKIVGYYPKWAIKRRIVPVVER